ncbi:YbaK/EbsC family protein [bacterium]|nr:MAG: YbaK/EbsC family protein [bacterium]
MPTIEDVKKFLSQRGVEVLEFDEPTPTSETAARAVGCEVGQIAKTVLFIVGETPVAIVASGDVRVKGSALKRAAALSGKARLPGEEEVVLHTGYRPGGVCPFLLPEGLLVLADSSLRRFEVVYAAAGNDHSAVPLTFEKLLELTKGREADVCA